MELWIIVGFLAAMACLWLVFGFMLAIQNAVIRTAAIWLLVSGLTVGAAATDYLKKKQ